MPDVTCRARMNFPITVANIGVVMTIFAVLCVGFIFLGYMTAQDIFTEDPVVHQQVLETISIWKTISGTVGFVIIIIILFKIFGSKQYQNEGDTYDGS